jgi:threonine aldolase
MSNKTIDFRSDTVTKPTPAMLHAMFSAEVGDDVFGTDPSVNALEEKAAHLFGMESALFCPSGTQTNQIALQLHCGRLDEVVCDFTAHIYQYETGGYAHNGGIAIKPIHTSLGKLEAKNLAQYINPDFDWLPRTALICIENTCNRAGGLIYTLEEMTSLSHTCRQLGVKFHLDGARIFNALVELNIQPNEIGHLFDSISICMSKGLGAPVGSLLLGKRKDIKMARRLRKVMGGGMRQSGYLAAACIYALDNHVDRLKEDHQKARMLEATLRELSYVKEIKQVQSNMVIFSVDGLSAAEFSAKMNQQNILCTGMSDTWVRFVTHLDVSEGDVADSCNRLRAI